MQLVITLRKDVEDPEEGRQVADFVKERIADRPDVTMTAHVTNHFDLTEEPS